MRTIPNEISLVEIEIIEQLSSINISQYKYIRAPLPRKLSPEYQSCITEMEINSICHIPHNISFQILGELGRVQWL